MPDPWLNKEVEDKLKYRLRCLQWSGNSVNFDVAQWKQQMKDQR